jgi:heavy metal sensor kinase
VLELLRLGLGVAEPIMVILGGIVGYWLAGRALAPVASITDLAGRIQADDLSARLALDLPDDELGRLSRTFDAMLDRIEDAFERQRRFTGDAAHELRTPLSFLRSQVDFALARPRTPAEYEEALQGIDSDLDRVTRLVRSLLTLSRADTGNLPLHYEPVDLPGTIALLLEQYEPRATEAGIRLINASRPTPLTGDADRLIQVLVNLLDNALAHTPSGGEIEVGCGPAGDQARLWVRDTGAGIPPEHQERVFDRFYRVDTGRARERGGVGLGLSICKMIAEAHGGTIAISTPNGGGTRVELLLPVKP